MPEPALRGPLLIPRSDGSVAFHADGVLAGDARGAITYAGPADGYRASAPPRASAGVMLPPLIDVHTHLPQHPIRGRFCEGITDDAPGGRLLAGLQRNVFPVEARCGERDCAEEIARAFLDDTLAHGVVGGVAYMTPSVVATEAALNVLPASWRVGLVMMNQNCPADLRTDEATYEADVERLAARFGPRLIVTDRFAVAVTSPLRRRGAALAARLGLRTQTHLNEQVSEKAFVERTLYPDAGSYTGVYLRDGLLDHRCILAHCIHMRGDEWRILRDTGSVIAHCPTSNLFLGSGTMPLDLVRQHGIPYAIATDVGASPTVSMIAEMARFLRVHAEQSALATPSEALYRSTRAAAEIADLADALGTLEPGKPMSFVEVATPPLLAGATADDAIRALLPADLDDPAPTVARVTIAGRVRLERRVAVA